MQPGCSAGRWAGRLFSRQEGRQVVRQTGRMAGRRVVRHLQQLWEHHAPAILPPSFPSTLEHPQTQPQFRQPCIKACMTCAGSGELVLQALPRCQAAWPGRAMHHAANTGWFKQSEDPEGCAHSSALRRAFFTSCKYSLRSMRQPSTCSGRGAKSLQAHRHGAEEEQ